MFNCVQTIAREAVRLLPSPACGRGAGGEGASPLSARVSLHERNQMLGTQRDAGFDANDAPAESLQRLLPLDIARANFWKAMNAAVDLNRQLAANDGEVDDIGADRVLPPQDDARSAQGSERGPCNRLGHILTTPQTPGQFDVLFIAHNRIVPRSVAYCKVTGPHPRPLSRKRARGEGALALLGVRP